MGFILRNSGVLLEAPITPRVVSLKYSNNLDLLVVLRKGYKYRGIWAADEKKVSVKSEQSNIFSLQVLISMSKNPAEIYMVMSKQSP